MGGSSSGYGAKSSSSSRQNSFSGVQFPTDFLNLVGGTIGRPFTIEEIAALAPRTTSLFGGPSAAAPQPGFGSQGSITVQTPNGPLTSRDVFQGGARGPVTPGGFNANLTGPGTVYQPGGFAGQGSLGNVGPSPNFPTQPHPGNGAAAPTFTPPPNVAASNQSLGELQRQFNQQRAAPSAAGPFAPPGNQVGIGQPTSPPPPQLGSNDVNAALANQFADPRQRQKILESLNQGFQKTGVDPSKGFTYDQLVAAANASESKEKGEFIANVLPAILQGQQQVYGQFEDRNRFGPGSGTPGPGFNVNQGLANLGFGQAPTPAAAPGIREPGAIGGNQIGESQANIAPQGFQQYAQDLFRAQFDPVQREVERQGSLADRRLKAELAQSGLSSSGAGIGQLQQQRTERQTQLQAQAADAANRASVQAFGTQFAQEQQNAQLRQERNLQQAGLNQAAQVQNAQNILAGDTARGDLLLRTLGLNNQDAQQARADFLGLLGIAEADLQRLDRQQLESVGLLFNTYLQQFAAIAQAGQFSTGAGTSKSSSLALGGASSGGGLGGGGGGGGGEGG